MPHRAPSRTAIVASILITLCWAATSEAGRTTAQYVRQALGLEGRATLKNRYFIMRHGHSTAIEQGKVGDFASGLTNPGKLGVHKSITGAVSRYRLKRDTVIVTSKVERARQTAGIVQEVIGGGSVLHERRSLNERWYGKHHDKGAKNIRIPMNWAIDLFMHRPMEWMTSRLEPRRRDLPVTEAESAFAVLHRTLEVVKEMEEKYQGKDIILVSHLDPLFILERAFKGRAPEGLPVPYVHAADIRELQLAPR